MVDLAQPSLAIAKSHWTFMVPILGQLTKPRDIQIVSHRVPECILGVKIVIFWYHIKIGTKQLCTPFHHQLVRKCTRL